MPVYSDCHLHSSHSGDSDTPMEEMILQGISRGLTTMCFTEHQDFGYPDSPEQPGDVFLLNTDSYLYDHVCHGKDPYYPEFFRGRSEEEAYREYFESILENIKKFSIFDVYGHLDYVVRYGPDMDKNYSYEKYRDIFDEILKLLIEKGKGIELNTGGIKKGMKDFHPCTDVLKRYRELGGEIITVGSDSHDTLHIAGSFDRACQVLQECGFRYYTVFEKRTPEYIRL